MPPCKKQHLMMYKVYTSSAVSFDQQYKGLTQLPSCCYANHNVFGVDFPGHLSYLSLFLDDVIKM